LYYGALITLVLLLVWALMWWPERMLFVDPAFIAFEIINGGEMVISEHRYAAAVTQSVPLVISWLELPLPFVLIAYSASFYLLYLSVFLIVGFQWKQYGLATLLVVYLTLLVSDGYFWPNNEVHQGVAWAILFLGRFACLLRTRGGIHWYDHILLIFSLALATNAHLLVAAPLVFLWVHLLIGWRVEGDRIALAPVLIYTALIGLGIGLRYYLSHDSWYDGYKLEGVRSLSLESIRGSLVSGQLRTMLARVWPHYLTLPVVFVLSGISAWRAGRMGSFVLAGLAVLLYTVLVCVTYPAAFGRELLYYYESEWAGLAIIVATPLVLHVPETSGKWWIGTGLAILLFVPRLWAIGHSHTYFSDRLNNLKQSVQLLDRWPDGDKFNTENGALLREHFGVYWGMPIEVTLAGAVFGAGKETVALRVKDAPPLQEGDSLVFQSNFRRQPIRSLNPVYFQLDTLAPYRPILPRREEEWRDRLHRLPP
jgi:hypothetical protein